MRNGNKKAVEKKVVTPVVEVKPLEVKEVVEKAEVKAVAEKEVSAKKPAVKKVNTVKKPATAKKEVAKKSTVTIKEAMYLQFAGKTYTQEELIKSAKDVWKYDLNRKISEIEEIDLFVKPEESIVYFVVNGETSGSFVI